MAKKQQDYYCPRKVFYVPPDIRALGSVGGILIGSMYSEYRARISWAQGHKFKGNN